MKCCQKMGCTREAPATQRFCGMHQEFARIYRRKGKSRAAQGLTAEGDGLCSGCNEKRGWYGGLCKQCLGAA
jgi:hypothetical protein